jgi:hypothetical protein
MRDLINGAKLIIEGSNAVLAADFEISSAGDPSEL